MLWWVIENDVMHDRLVLGNYVSTGFVKKVVFVICTTQKKTISKGRRISQSTLPNATMDGQYCDPNSNGTEGTDVSKSTKKEQPKKLLTALFWYITKCCGALAMGHFTIPKVPIRYASYEGGSGFVQKQTSGMQQESDRCVKGQHLRIEKEEVPHDAGKDRMRYPWDKVIKK